MRVLHVVPDSAVTASHRYLGSTKDIRGRTEYLQTAGIDYDEIAVMRSDRALRTALEPMPLERYDVALIELALYPRSMKWLRRKAARLLQVVRPTNASSLQQLHLARLALYCSQTRLAGVRQSGLELLRGIRRFQKETECARRADFVLAITEWERQNYWQRLTSPHKVVTVPYFMPREYEDTRCREWQKSDDCVCLTSSTVTPFLLDATRNFERLVRRLGDCCEDWRFLVTGEVESREDVPASRIIRCGFVGDLAALLGRARAIALLSNYGFGFKTKVLDAVRHQCFMLVTARVYERMPSEVRPFCIVVDPTSVDSFMGALEQCRRPYPTGNPNEVFRQQAFRALDSILRG